MDPNNIQSMQPPMNPAQPSMGEGAPQSGISGAQPQYASEEQRQQLISMIEAIRGKLGQFNATSFAAQNKTDRIKRELLREVFEKLQMSGVDLTDRESVADFIAKLRAQNPELATMFEQAMDYLLGNGEEFSAEPRTGEELMDLSVPPAAPGIPGVIPNMNNQTPNEAIPKEIQ